MAWLGVDMGGTASRWVLTDRGGAVIARGQAPGATALRADAGQRTGFEAALRTIRAHLPVPPRAACLGLTGAGHAPGPALAAACAEPLALAPGRVRVMNDVQLAWHAAFPGGGPGHLVLAGTGSVGLGRTGDAWVEVGGRGALIDDAGSAVWITLRALDQVYRHIDESGRPAGCEILAGALFAAIGARDWDGVCARIHAMPRGDLGALAVAVDDAARTGDAVATSIMTRGADELARLARALRARCGPAPLVMAGGVLAPDGILRQRLAMLLAGQSPQFARLDAADAGARLAMRLAIGKGNNG